MRPPERDPPTGDAATAGPVPPAPLLENMRPWMPRRVARARVRSRLWCVFGEERGGSPGGRVGADGGPDVGVGRLGRGQKHGVLGDRGGVVVLAVRLAGVARLGDPRSSRRRTTRRGAGGRESERRGSMRVLGAGLATGLELVRVTVR